MERKTTVLAITTCFNRKNKTRKSLDTLIALNPNIDFSFIIVDDNSTDGTSNMLAYYPNVNVLHGDGNLYYSGGMRKGIEEAKKRKGKYDFCLFYNDDVSFFEHSLERLVSLSDETRKIIVGATCDENGKLTYAGAVKASNIIPKCRIVYSSDKVVICDTCNANCVLIDFTTFLKLDNIDSCYSHSMGDYDYGFQATKAGYTLYVSDFYVGMCEETTEKGSWRDKSLTRKERLKRKNQPKGTPNKEWFHYLYKNYNLFTAIVYSVTPYVRILIGK